MGTKLRLIGRIHKVCSADAYEIRQTQYSLGKNDIHPSMKRDMDITQGSLRKAGVPTPIVKRLRKEANKFYRELLKKKSKCTS